MSRTDEPRRRGRLGWLIAALALVALMLWLGRPESAAVERRREVRVPTEMSHDEAIRMRNRRVTRPAPPVVATDDPTPLEPVPAPNPADPLLLALGGLSAETAVVFEANALRSSPVGQLLLNCLDEEARQGLDQARELLGIDPLQDVDRVALTPNGVVVSGHFGDARWADGFPQGALTRAYGDEGTFYSARTPELDAEGPGALASWGGQMLILGDDEDALRRTIDVLEGREAAPPSPISEEQTYGEVYGVVSPDLLGTLIGEESPELGERLRSVASGVELHMDASRDVGLSARIRGDDAEGIDELKRTLSGLLAGAKLKARAEGEDELLELLQLADVDAEGGELGMDLALPYEWIEARLGDCRAMTDAPTDVSQQ